MPQLPRIRALVAAIAVLVVALGATALDAGVAGAAKHKKKHQVTIKGTSSTGYQFKPQSITIKKGQKVHWHWNSDEPHNVFFSDKKHSKTANSVKDYTLKFTKKGTFTYFCTVHGFSGTVVVKKQ